MGERMDEFEIFDVTKKKFVSRVLGVLFFFFLSRHSIHYYVSLYQGHVIDPFAVF